MFLHVVLSLMFGTENYVPHLGTRPHFLFFILQHYILFFSLRDTRSDLKT